MGRTNFIGAARELNELHKFFVKKQTQCKLNEFFVKQKIEWRTIPRNAPHFGDIWETAIKSAKYHIKRVIGDVALNYDKMSTVLAEIEAILNSRPISQILVRFWKRWSLEYLNQLQARSK